MEACEDEAAGGGRSRHGNVVSGGQARNVVQAARIGQVTLATPRDDPPAARQLPLLEYGFVNRTRELELLHRLVGDSADAGSATGQQRRIVVLTGLGGVGKTQLVVRWAEELDGTRPQLYCDLTNARNKGVVDTSAVLGGWLRALGATPEEAGGDEQQRAAAFRTHTAGKKPVILLDNAEQAADVRALLPSAGTVLVTSRRALPRLRIDGARELAVDPLSAEAGVRLLSTWLGADTGIRSGAGRRLVDLCAGLPLALRAVGARLLDAGDGAGARLLLDELTDERRRLDGFAAAGEGDLAGVLDATYRGLPPGARQALRTLGAFPGTSFTVDLLAHTGMDGPEQALHSLAGTHLATRLDADRPADRARYRLHDLVLVHARGLARAELPQHEQEQLLERFTDFYRTRAAAADLAALRHRFRLSPVPEERFFEDGASAVDWLDEERANLLAVLRAAAEAGNHDAVWRLCESLWALYDSRRHLLGEWKESHRIGIESARWEGRPDAEMRLRNQLSRAHLAERDHPAAAEQLSLAAELFDLVTEPVLPAMIHESEGLLALAEGHNERAADRFSLALEANGRAGDVHGTVVQRYNLAQALLGDGRAEEAGALLEEALRDVERTHDDPMRARIGLVRAEAERRAGRWDEAVRLAVEAAEWADRLAQHAKLRQALQQLSELAEELEDEELAEVCRERAEAVRRHLHG
ncbi:tetratricopeptide repeat protein [Streptomyces sulphureus]|uniref:tetratricopeptide repeat protein n=1 Tax=Streptomyces sulphureus TaxID=47758 RepID=UPI000360499D|nr:tetratricopeptide repeat protein [Streptomyces sulphureus]